MKLRLLLQGSIILSGIFTLSLNAQTITAPSGQNLTITNPVNVTGGSVNIPIDSAFKIAGKTVLSTKGTLNFIGGDGAGQVNTGQNNIFLGSQAGYGNTSGNSNVMLGTGAGFANVSGGNNVFIGISAGRNNGSASFNTFIGGSAGYFAQAGYNTFFGNSSGYNTTTGSANVGLGVSAGQDNTTGTGNIFIGNNSGTTNSIGFHNTFIGTNTSASTNNLSFATAVGFGAVINASNTIVLGQNATTITGQGLGAGLSGLRFANLTSASSTTSVSGNKVLTVDGSGNVVLAALTSGTINSVGGPTGPVAESTWKNQDGYLYNNSTNGVVINGSGLDGNSLIVKGGVLSKEVNVKVEGSESWPDYVFKPSYKRMTLDEVEKFININGHLPNVASATEMAATGNNLNKTDIKLLEKVEELTLYLLEMKKSNEAQNVEIQNLKKQVKSLRRK